MAETKFDDLPDFGATVVAGASAALVKDVWGGISEQFWKWYKQHKDDSIHTRILIIGVNIKVHKLHTIFEAIFGKEPA